MSKSDAVVVACLRSGQELAIAVASFLGCLTDLVNECGAEFLDDITSGSVAGPTVSQSTIDEVAAHKAAGEPPAVHPDLIQQTAPQQTAPQQTAPQQTAPQQTAPAAQPDAPAVSGAPDSVPQEVNDILSGSEAAADLLSDGEVEGLLVKARQLGQADEQFLSGACQWGGVESLKQLPREGERSLAALHLRLDKAMQKPAPEAAAAG